MQDFFANLTLFFNKAPVIYLATVTFTGVSFLFMKRFVNDYGKRSTEWPFILIMVLNGIVPTLMTASFVPFIGGINPALVTLLVPVITVVEFSLLARDTFRTYVFFGGIMMLLLSCIYGVSAAVVTAVPVPETVTSSLHTQTSALTFSLLLLSVILIVVGALTRKNTDILKAVIHEKNSGRVIFIFMLLNGLVLAVATGIDYNVYFTDLVDNPLRTATIIGMIMRYALISVTGIVIFIVQCRVEAGKVLVNELSRNVVELESIASTDPLTGLYNRSAMEDLIKNITFSEKDEQGAMFMLDLDHFKEVNDNLGHPTGDKLLVDASATIKSVFRDADIVGRLGGDEFCVFMTGTNSFDVVKSKAEQLNEKVCFEYKKEDGTAINTSVSIGIALYPNDGKDYTELYRHADVALYRAKENGRNQHCFYAD